MGLYLNRRQWLKTSAFATAGLFASPDLSFLRKHSFDINPQYESKEFIRLNNNESPYGISQRAREAVVGSIRLSNRYPHRQYQELKELIAERENISPDNIILGAGSTEVMTTLIHFYRTRGEGLAADPTYFDFVYYAKVSDFLLHQIPLTENYEHDLGAMEQRINPKISLIYICNPNNPIGSITPKDKLYPFCDRASQKALVVVDEAYHEYVEDSPYGSMVDLVKKGKNVIVTRTFSKLFGLAGLRIGYGMTKPQIIESLERIERNFAPVSNLSLKAAIATYKDKEFCSFIKKKNREVKSYLYKELEKLGLYYVPSFTNFVFFRVSQDGKKMAKEFEARNILIRSFVYNENHWIRVSLGTKEEMNAFVSTLKDIV
jgi:histidinol-phosphate aminotransferase